jgi:SnoaL-like polyketide cyclase
VEGALRILDEKHIWETETLPVPVVGYRRAMQMDITAFPDLHFRIDQLLASGDHVVTRYTATGTHNGDLMGFPPTSVGARLMAALWWRFETVRPCAPASTGTPRACFGNLASCPADKSRASAEVSRGAWRRRACH